MSIDAMKQALEALETCKVYDEADAWFDIDKVEEAADALRLAIEQAEREDVPSVEDNSQNWKGMDGTIAWHLIERHANGWADVGKMMGEWLAANTTPPQQERQEPVAHLWQHSETGRTRIVMPDQIITADATWFVVGPLYLAPPQQEKQEPHTEWLVCPNCNHKSPYSPIKAKTNEEDAKRVTKQARAAMALEKHEPRIDLGKYAGTYGGYTAPPQRQPLTDKRIMQLLGAGLREGALYTKTDVLAFAREIERAHEIGGEE